MDDWDWELLLHDTPEIAVEETEQPRISASSSSEDGGVIRSDYFSLDSHHKYVEEDDEELSDNPSWIDPSGSSVAGRGERIRINSSSNSDSSDLPLLIEPHSDCAAAAADSGGIGDIRISETDQVEQEVDQKLYSNSNLNSGCETNGTLVTEEKEKEIESNETKRVVWWRVPLEVLRYCVLRVSPVWSLSMAAAAIMGFVILRRRYLYKMKRNTQGLQLKVIVDDKKVSQFMSRVARLNEAFSVVKRVPIIRPSMPAPGLALWPVVSMR